MRLFFPLFFFAIVLAGCSTLHQGSDVKVSMNETWALLPFINNTETPYAAERAESVTAALLYARGVRRLERFSADSKDEQNGISMDRGERRQREAREWAKGLEARYALSGTVNEWRYKVGLDGEPVAGIAMQLVDIPSGKVVWSGAAGRSGWSRAAVSAVAQQVIDQLLAGIPLTSALPPANETGDARLKR